VSVLRMVTALYDAVAGEPGEQEMSKPRCAAWDGNQCKATKDLTNCVFYIEQGKLLRGPERVVAPLCPKHFELLLPKRNK
jgi:hypothetical protein